MSYLLPGFIKQFKARYTVFSMSMIPSANKVLALTSICMSDFDKIYTTLGPLHRKKGVEGSALPVIPLCFH